MRKSSICAVGCMLVLLAGCGVSSMTPEEIAEGVAGVYAEALADLAEIINTKPEADSINEAVLTLRENVIQKMVDFGTLREKLTEEEKSSLNSALMTEMRELQQNEVFQSNWETMSQVSQHYYAETERDLGSAIGDFNVITQYSQFDLLKRQSPREAERLGIE